MLDNRPGFTDSGKVASQAYWNALRKLRDAWHEVFGEELEYHGTLAMESFENALDALKKRLAQDEMRSQELSELLDLQPGEDIGKALLSSADLDDIAPNRVKAAILVELQSKERGKHELRSVLRGVMDALFVEPGTTRPRVGPNRHWPRLLQYLRELEEETDWYPDGQGIRLVNIGGGRVAREPTDPGRLNVVIDPDFL